MTTHTTGMLGLASSMQAMRKPPRRTMGHSLLVMIGLAKKDPEPVVPYDTRNWPVVGHMDETGTAYVVGETMVFTPPPLLRTTA